MAFVGNALGSVKPSPIASTGVNLSNEGFSLKDFLTETKLNSLEKGLEGFSTGVSGIQNASLANELGKINASTFLQNAKVAEFQGRENLVDLERTRAILQGRQRAIAGASGVVASSGSALNITVDTARGIARAKVRSEFSTYVQIESLKYQAEISRWKGKMEARNQMSKAIGGFSQAISSGALLASTGGG